MSTTPLPTPVSPDSQAPGGVNAAGWLSGQSMFGAHDEHQKKRAFGASLATVALHGAFLLMALFFFAYHQQTVQDTPPPDKMMVVYLQQPGPGGGGGGSPAPAPKKALSIPKPQAQVPVPVTPPPVVTPPPIPTLNAPVMTTNSDLVQSTGSSAVSLAAYGGGGRGTGLGSGSGDGVGPGTGGGFGGGAFRVGNGVQSPILLKDQKPAYTADAMRAKIQGRVLLEAVVDEKGTVNDVRVLKSLDRLYGLDAEAMKAARLWLFRPGHDKDNKPVPVVIQIELTFNLH